MKNIKKCPKTLSGKHVWTKERKWTSRKIGMTYETVPNGNTGRVLCDECGVIDDIGESKI